MTDAEKRKITILYEAGLGYRKIAAELDLSVNTVKSFCRRTKESGKSNNLCKECGIKLEIKPNVKKKIFCCDKCRNLWWKKHPEKIKRKAFYKHICLYCGKEFESYGNNHRKFCSRKCYADARRKR